MENNYCVYKHTAPNGKVYIGITGRNPKTRWKNGRGYAGSNPHFTSAIEKYGWQNIKHDILLDHLTSEQAKSFEQMYIAMYQSNNREFGYNKTSGGDENCKPNDETLEKMRSNQWTMRPVDQYTLDGRYINSYRSGAEADRAIHANAQCAIRSANGSCLSAHGYIWIYSDDPNKEQLLEERVKRISEGVKNSRSRPIMQFTKTGNFVAEHKNITDAGRSINRLPAHISQCADGARISAHGFIWLYADDVHLYEILSDRVNQKAHGGKMYGKGNHQAKRIKQFTRNGEYIATYDCIADASRALWISVSTISSCLSNKKRSKTAGGYIFEYSNEERSR